MRITIMLLRPDGISISTNTFEGHDIRHIASAVNYWLRIEVTPYWKPNTIRMEVIEIVTSSVYVCDALRHMLAGLAVAWRMSPSHDPEDQPEEG